MKVYIGERLTDGTTCQVMVDDTEAGIVRPLPVRLDLRNHSPTGFEWGYNGSGPAQLALSILCDHFGPALEDEALARYQRFKFRVVGGLDRDRWTLTSDQVAAALRQCYACDEPATGTRDRRPEGGRLEPACDRHRDSP